MAFQCWSGGFGLLFMLEVVLELVGDGTMDDDDAHALFVLAFLVTCFEFGFASQGCCQVQQVGLRVCSFPSWLLQKLGKSACSGLTFGQ